MPTDPPPPDSSRPPGSRGCLYALGILLLAAILTAALSLVLINRSKHFAQRLLADEFRNLALQLAETFVATFQFTPRIDVGSETLHVQHAERVQLITAETSLDQSYEWSHTWLGSTKRLAIEATFVARAGLDLEKPILVVIDPDSRAIRASLPPPEIFGVDMRDLRVVTDESGLWNKLTTDERNVAIQELQRIARQKIESGDTLRRADTNAQMRLRRLLRPFGEQVSLTFDPQLAPAQ
jgi:hypothetical protein